MSEFETSRRACLFGAAALLAAPVVDALAAELQAPAVKRGYVDGPYGQIHYRLARPARSAKRSATPAAATGSHGTLS